MSMQSTKVITGPNTRWSYVHVWEPKSIGDGAPKYSISLIIPKSDKKTVDAVKAAIRSAYDEGQSKLKGSGKTVPALSAIKTPLRDGDAERKDDTAYAGCWFINATSNLKPGIVDAERQPIIEQEQIYSGCYGRASVSFFAYSVNGNRGIGASINNLQKIRDGEPLGGRASAEADFATADDEDDFLS